MGYAGLTPHGYVRKRIVPESAATATRALVREVVSWSNKDLQNWLDELTAKAEKDVNNVQRYWEDNFAYGVYQIKVIRIDDYWAPTKAEGPRDPSFRLYAITRPCEQPTDRGQTEILVTVVNEYGYDEAIRSDRWKLKKPERSRFTHPGEPEMVAVEFMEEQMEEQRHEPVVVAPTTGRDLEPLLISYYTTPGHSVAVECLHVTRATLNENIEDLIDRGVEPNSIQIWRQVKSRVKISVEVED